MLKSTKKTGAIEYIRSPKEQAIVDELRDIKGRVKGKSRADLTPTEVRDLVHAMAKHFKIL